VGAADLVVDLPRERRTRVAFMSVRPGVVRVIVRFPDGTVFDALIPTELRLRKAKPTKPKSAEIGRLLELRDLYVRKVGRGHFLPGYNKWAQAAIDRWAEAYRRKGSGRGTPSGMREKAVPRISREVDEARKILAKHPSWDLQRKASHVARLVARVTGGKPDTVRRHIAHLFLR
jgi:hypothetical protein